MKTKVIHSGYDARLGLCAGIDKLYDAVASTLGPYGASVIIENDSRKDNPPTVTKDGVSVARIINFDNQLEQLGARIVLQASSQADTKSGDGTTTTVVLAKALVDAATRITATGVLPIVVKARLDKLSEDVVAYLEAYSESFEVTDEVIDNVARISANGDRTLAAVALSAVREANGGPVTVKPYRGEVDEMEALQGSIITGSPLNGELVPRDESAIVSFRDTYVIVLDARATVDQIESICRNNGDKNTVVFVTGARDGVAELASEWNTRTNAHGNVIVVETPGAGQNRRRYQAILCTMASCKITSNVDEIHYGRLKEFTISQRNMCIFTDVDMQETVKHLTELREAEIRGSQKYKHLDTALRFVLGRRVTIYVGGLTDADIKERHDRMVDAVSAIECAKDGVIPGGGTVLAFLALSHKDTDLASALMLPMCKIYMNGGVGEDVARSMVVDAFEDARKSTRRYLQFQDLLNSTVVDLLDPQYAVYDPVRVTINAVRAACAVAGTVITSNCCVVEDRDGHF